MRSVPNESDREELDRLRAEPWMVDLLALNPEYPHWGPHEDYMWKEGQGWDSRVMPKTWAEFGPWQLDEMNECVHFYFSVERASRECAACGQQGYNPETRKIADAFYAHDGVGRRWCDEITQDEVQALVDAGRLYDFTHVFTKEGWKPKDPPVVPTAEQVNAWQRSRSIGHDAINRWILVEARAKRLGVWGRCAECEGHGSIFTEPVAHVSLVLWMLHPRKGASRGVEVQRVERAELPAVFAWLQQARDRNADRFAKLPKE